MNPSAFLCLGSEPVSLPSSARTSSEWDFEKRSMDVLQASAIQAATERTGLSRTGSGAAGSFKGGLASLLSTAPAGSSLSLQRSSFSSDHVFLSATFSSDLSSFDSGNQSRSYQTLGSLSATPKSIDKSPGRWPAPSKKTFMAHASPVFSPLNRPSFHVSQPQRSNPGSLPSRAPWSASTPQLPAHRVQSSIPSLAGPASSLVEVKPVVFGLGAAPPLQAKPTRPPTVSDPLVRSVGFSLPRHSRTDGELPWSSLQGVDSPSGETLGSPENRRKSLLGQPLDGAPEASNCAFRGAGGDEAFLTPACSFNNLPDRDACVCSENEMPRGGLEPCSSFSFSQTTYQEALDPFVTASVAMERPNMKSERESVLRLVEAANGSQGWEPSALLSEAQREFPVFEEKLVKRAFRFAATAHQGQLRKNGEPFLLHCLETAKTLARIGADSTVVAAGLLHDCLDDTPMTVEELEASFGTPMVRLVQGVSHLGNISQAMRDLDGALSAAEPDRLAVNGRAMSEAQLERLRIMILSLEDVRVVLVKLADRLHNLRTLSGLSLEKRRRVASETLEVFVPLANRLGIWSWKSEMEDLCFRTLWPDDHMGLQSAVQEGHGDSAVLRSIRKLDAELRKANVKFLDLHGRAKSLFSIFNKMKSKGKTLMEVFDRRGIRLIVPEDESCYKALAVVRRVWQSELSSHFKDYIVNPKGNGYQSLHVVVEDEDGHPLEIQIRTQAMHQVAEFGVAAHWRYKEKGNGVKCGRNHSKGDLAVCSHEEDETSAEEEQFATQRIEWARLCLSWVAEITDAKVRLAAGDSVKLCPFPNHVEGCCFGARSGAPGGVPRPSASGSEPVFVVLLDSGRAVVKNLQGTTSRESFVKEFLEDRGQAHLMDRVSLLVNSELVPVDSSLLQMSDLVEVLVDAPLSPVLGGKHSPEELEDDELLFEPEAIGGSAWLPGGALPVDDEDERRLLPQFARESTCPLELEFQRRKLAVTFGSNSIVLEKQEAPL